MAKKKTSSSTKSSVFFNPGQTIQFYPDSVGPRTFFFSSLREEQDPKAQHILDIGEKMVMFGSSNLQQVDDDTFLDSTYAAIEFLKAAAQKALADERRIFEEKIVPLCEGTQYESRCKQCFDGDTVDYINFLALINDLTKTNEKSLVLLNDLYNTMKNYNDISNEIINTDDYTKITSNYGNFSTQIKAQAEGKDIKIVSDLAKSFYNKLKIYANQTNAEKNENFQRLHDEVINHLPDLFSGKTRQYSMRSTNDYQTELISEASRFILAYKKLNKEIKNNSYKIDNLIKPFLEELKNNTKLEEQFYSAMRAKIQQLDKQEELLQQQGKQLNSVLNEIYSNKIKTDTNKYISGFTIEVRRYLADLYPQLAGEKNKFVTGRIFTKDENGRISENKSLVFNINSKAGQKEYFDALREVFKNEKLTDLEIIDKINALLKIKNKKTEIITISSEYDAARIQQLIAGSITLTGKQNLRNDLTGYTIGTISLQQDGVTQQEIQELYKILNQVTDKIESQYVMDYITEIENETTIKDAHGNIIKKGKKGRNYKLRSSLNAQKNAEDTLLEQIKKETERNNLLIEAKNIFQTDESVKFHETYNEKTGFKGGSLGANVEDQIENINNMLKLGGISPIDADFLLSAVLNAGPALIGAHQRSALENYFSTVASMLMFRSGGQYLQSLKNEGLNSISNDTTKIHIYSFNTLFFPESYILQKTYEGLYQCVNLLTTSASNYGSRAYIYNPVSNKDIQYSVEGEGKINHENKKRSPIKIPDWEKTATENYKRVKIDMVLMGGFLDVMEKMLVVMNNTFK